MLFHVFSTQSERRAFGGSDFIEIQYCKLKRSADRKRIVSVHAVECWKEDSLYIADDDWETFLDAYGEMITGGTYNNLQTGYLDGYGINYFSPRQTESIIEQLKEEKPQEFQTLLTWLERGEQYNGFYILGV